MARDRQRALDAAGAGTGTSLGSNRVQLATVAPRASARAMSLLEGNADVSYVEPDRTIHLFANPVPNDPQFKKEWGLNNTGQTVDFTAGTPGADIGAERAWGVTTGKKSVVVGVIDTGIDASHPDQENRFPAALKNMEGTWLREAEFLELAMPFGIPRLIARGRPEQVGLHAGRNQRNL